MILKSTKIFIISKFHGADKNTVFFVHLNKSLFRRITENISICQPIQYIIPKNLVSSMYHKYILQFINLTLVICWSKFLYLYG